MGTICGVGAQKADYVGREKLLQYAGRNKLSLALSHDGSGGYELDVDS